MNTGEQTQVLGFELRLDVFAGHVGSMVRVQRGPEWVGLELREAVALGGHRPVEAEKFSLIFVGAGEKRLQQGMHAFDHPALSGFELFITPVMSPQAGECWYEAVINRGDFP